LGPASGSGVEGVQRQERERRVQAHGWKGEYASFHESVDR